MAEFSTTLLMLDRNEEVLSLTEGMAGAASNGESPAAAEAEWVAWLLNSRLTALRRLGRTDEALATAQQAARIGALGPDGVEHQMNVGFVFSSLGRMQDAAQAVNDMPGLAGYGKAAQALLQFAAARERGDAKARDAARAVILAQRDDARLFHREMLLEEGNLDGAAAVLIEQLRSPVERGETLASLQDMRTYPSLPGDVRIDAAWRALKQRADVQAEVAASAASSATTWSAPPPRAEQGPGSSSGTGRVQHPRPASAPAPRCGCPSLRGSARTAPSPCPHRPGFRRRGHALVAGDRTDARVVGGRRQRAVAVVAAQQRAHVARATSIDCCGENGSRTPYSCAVSGISCITPCAPLLETASASKLLSAWAIARSQASSTPVPLAAALNCRRAAPAAAC
jgi:hypothetical protein